MKWWRHRQELERCGFVGNGLQCMRTSHQGGTHATASPLPFTVWDGERWNASAEFLEGDD